MNKKEPAMYENFNGNSIEKKAKNSNREGSVRYKTENLLEGRAMVNGKTICVYVKVKGSSEEHAKKADKEVRKKLKKAIFEAEQTGVVPCHLKLEVYMETCLEAKFARGEINTKTYGDYKVLINSHVKGTPMGQAEISKITVKELDAFYIKLLSDRKDNKKDKDGNTLKLSPLTVRKIHALIRSSLTEAVREEYIFRNVAEKAKLPQDKNMTIKVTVLDESEQKRFLMEAKSRRLFAAFLLMLASGIRIGEALALEWADVDLEKGTISISNTVQRVKNFDGQAKTRIEVGSPKTPSGYRTIALPTSVVSELKKFRDIQEKEKAEWGDSYEDNGLVFCTQNGRYLEGRNFTRTYYSIRKKAGICVSKNLHSLRHSYATMLLGKNVHPKVVSELLGHKDIRITLNTYTHIFPDIKQKAVQKLDDFFSSVLSTVIDLDLRVK